MLFQGQEFASTSPFYYFADHNPELAKMVSQGRRDFLSQFPTLATPQAQERIPEPADPETFRRCKLDFSEREKHDSVYALHRDLLCLRREEPFASQRPRGLDGAVLGATAWVLRYFGDSHENDRLLVINLGMDLHLDPAPEPLLAPPRDHCWEILWSSEHVKYGGNGTPPMDDDGNWHLPGEAAVVLQPRLGPSGMEENG